MFYFTSSRVLSLVIIASLLFFLSVSIGAGDVHARPCNPEIEKCRR